MTGASVCRHCGAPLRAVTRFCGRCGRPTPTVRRERAAEERGEFRRSQRAGLAVAIVFVGVVLSLVAVFSISNGDRTAGTLLAMLALDLAVGGVATWFLGPGAGRESVPLRPAPRWTLLAVPVGAAAFAVSWGYVALLHAVTGGESGASPDGLGILAAVVVAPLIEEWLCRGVLWTALSRVVPPRRTVVLTALLFAVMHGLQGLYLALPHRFVGGLLLGWLRWRSGSLVPCVVAHLVHNALAVGV